MEWKDIALLVAGIVAWIFSSYRSFQKQKASRPLITKPVPQVQVPKTAGKKEIAVNQQYRQESPSHAYPDAVSLEKITSEIYSTNENYTENQGMVKSRVNKKRQEIELDDIVPITHFGNELIDEIHSGKMDWRKTIILTEVIRPVYF